MSDETPDAINYDELNVEEVRELVADIEKPSLLRNLRESEELNKDRKTAKQAIDERLAALDGESEEADADDRQDGDDADTDAESGHGTLPRSAAQPDTVVVRNPHKTTLHLQGLRGSLAPGETKEYPESDRLRQYIRENKVQVVRSN